MKYSLVRSEFSGLPSQVIDWIKTIRTPIFRIFFISTVKLEDIYIPPKRISGLEGIIPTAVTTENKIVANRLIELFFAGLQNISDAITITIAAVSSNS
jgi:hypothetical protein